MCGLGAAAVSRFAGNRADAGLRGGDGGIAGYCDVEAVADSFLASGVVARTWHTRLMPFRCSNSTAHPSRRSNASGLFAIMSWRSELFFKTISDHIINQKISIAKN